jgi:hypothetical protein
MNSTITELKLQRWVDGDISRDEERELLADCDRHPGQWRRVALAFVEERAMSREFATEFGTEVRLQTKTEIRSTDEPTPTVTAASWLASRRVQQWCAIAASLLLGVVVGNSMNWNWPSAPQPIASNHNSPTPSHRSAPTAGTSMVEYIPDQSRGERYHMPLLDEQQIPAHFFDANVELTGLPPEFEQLLRLHGIELQGRRHWKSFEFNEGEVIVIPTLGFEIRQGAFEGRSP